MRRLFLALDRFTTGLVTATACAALALAATLAVYQVFMRYVMREPTAWSEPTLQMLIIYMVYLGVAATFRAGALVSVDLLLRWSRGYARRALEALILVAALVLLAHMFWYGWTMTERARFNVNPTLGISTSWGFAAIPIGAVFAMIAVVAHFLDPPARHDLADGE